jgi:hypothetical protein
VAEQLVIAAYHRQRSFVASQMPYIDGGQGRPLDLFGDYQMPDGGNILTAERECLLYCGSQLTPAIAGSELQQLDHLPRALLTTMARVQPMPPPVEGLWPAPCLAPLGQCSRPGQCAGLALQHIQVVLQIEHLLLAAEAAFVPRHTPALMPQLNKISVYASFDLGSGLQRNRVSVGPHAHTAQPIDRGEADLS